jgi:hypothetical protein
MPASANATVAADELLTLGANFGSSGANGLKTLRQAGASGDGVGHSKLVAWGQIGVGTNMYDNCGHTGFASGKCQVPGQGMTNDIVTAFPFLNPSRFNRFRILTQLWHVKAMAVKACINLIPPVNELPRVIDTRTGDRAHVI